MKTAKALLLGAILLLIVVLVSLVGCGGPAEGTAEWYLDRGNELVDEGRYDEAIEQYDELSR